MKRTLITLTLAATSITAPALADGWHLNAAACPDLVEDRLDERENRRDRREDRRDRAVDRGPLDRLEDRIDRAENRLDRREDRRDRSIISCPASAYTYVGGPTQFRPTHVVYADGRYYAQARNGRRVLIVVDR